jgi:hypothetical protein
MYGLLIVLVVLFRPNGAISLYYSAENRFKAWRASKKTAKIENNGGEA